ncbi:V-type ATPase, D subunit [Streptomyces sp. GC420]|nr:V-type ATPase, D subunit [Streptomyces sp. GC420]
MRLRHSLDVALRGADLLDRKLRILRTRHEELLRVERSAGERWRRTMSEAETWMLRGLLLGGEEALDTLGDREPATVEFTWTSTMGVRHPAAAGCTVPPRGADARPPDNTALVNAETACAEALRAAAAHAAARAAARAVGAEILSTRRRVRALQRHWIPRLEQALARADLALEQSEHEDAVRRRWAALGTEGRGQGQGQGQGQGGARDHGA